MNLAATTPRLNSSSRILAVIPARLGATRLPRKPLRMLGGKPLIVRVYEQIAHFHIADQIVVATDDNEVVGACANHNVPVRLTGAHHQSGTDRIAEVAMLPEFSSYEILLNVQGDEPFISRDAIAGALRMVVEHDAEVGTTAARAGAEILNLPDVVKVVTTEAGRALYFSRAPIPFLRDPADASMCESLVRQHIGVYAYKRKALLEWVALPPHPLELTERLEQLRALAQGMSIGVAVVDHAPGRGIDTEEDLVRANAQFKSMTSAVADT